MARSPLFLERRSYRLRRMKDAVRLLPLIGLAMWMVPLLWPRAEAATTAGTDAMRLSTALEYIFGIWILLVLAAWALWRVTRDDSEHASGRVTPEPKAD